MEPTSHRVVRETTDADNRPICSVDDCANFAHADWHSWPLCPAHKEHADQYDVRRRVADHQAQIVKAAGVASA